MAMSTALATRFQTLRGGSVSQLPARRAGPSPALVAARNKLEAMRGSARKARANAGGKGGNVEAAIATGVGGAVSGAIKAKLPEVAGFDTRIPAAAALIGTGLFVVRGRMGGWLLNIGAGVGACVVSDLVEDMLDGDE